MWTQVGSGDLCSGSCGDRKAQFLLLVLFCVWEDGGIWVHEKNYLGRTCVMVQWLGPRAFPAIAPVSIPGWGTKILQVSRCGRFFVVVFFPPEISPAILGACFSKVQSALSCFFCLEFFPGCTVSGSNCSAQWLDPWRTGWWAMFFVLH